MASIIFHPTCSIRSNRQIGAGADQIPHWFAFIKPVQSWMPTSRRLRALESSRSDKSVNTRIPELTLRTRRKSVGFEEHLATCLHFSSETSKAVDAARGHQSRAS
jgi:hypothetical protein